MWLLNKTGESNVDFSAVPINDLGSNTPVIYGQIEPAAFPYPLINAHWTEPFTDTYEFVWGQGKGVYFPTFTGVSTTNQHNPARLDNTTVIVGRSTGSPLSFGWNFLPFQTFAIGPSLPAADGILPWTADFIGINNLSNDLPLTVGGNVLLNGHAVSSAIYAGNTVDLIWRNAFELIDGDIVVWNIQTTNDGVWNYSLIEKQSGAAPSMYGTKWKEAAFSLGGPFNYTQDYLQLSDPVDDALYQDAVNFAIPVSYYDRSNGEEFFISIIDYSGPTPPNITCFAFSKDFTTYRRINVTVPLDYGEALYFEDIEGFKYIFGYADVGGDGLYSAFSRISQTVKVFGVFSLGCWSPCANLLHRFIGEDLPNVS